MIMYRIMDRMMSPLSGGFFGMCGEVFLALFVYDAVFTLAHVQLHRRRGLFSVVHGKAEVQVEHIRLTLG